MRGCPAFFVLYESCVIANISPHTGVDQGYTRRTV